MTVDPDPERQVGERQVAEQLPLTDQPLQVVDRRGVQLGVLGEQLAQGGHLGQPGMGRGRGDGTGPDGFCDQEISAMRSPSWMT